MVLAPDLRDAVFQAAIQGNLTERLPSDSNVSDLFSEIVSKKVELLRQKKRSKDSSDKITPYNVNDLDELPGIPNEWRWVKLGELCEKIGAGSTPSGGSKVYVREGIKFLREQNIHNDSLVLDGVAFIDKATNQSLKGSQVYAQDILMNITGASIGRNSLVPDDFDLGNVNQHVLIIRLIDKRVRMYLHHCLQSPFIFNQMMSEQKGDKPGLSATRVSNFMIPLPPMEEQYRIVARVDELLKHIDEYNIMEDQLTALKAEFPSDMRGAILQAAMQGKLTEQLNSDTSVDDLIKTILQEKQALIDAHKIKQEKSLPAIADDEIPFEIPHSWAWVRWGNLSNSIQYGYNAPAQPSGRIRMVRISDIQNNEVNWSSVPFCEISESEIETYRLNENDILFARTGGTLGKSYIVTNMTEEAIYAGYLIRSNYSKRLYPQFLKYFMESPLYWQQLQNGTTKTAQPNCNGKTLSKMLVPLPPIEEQQRIVKRLDALLPLCDTLVE